MSSERGGGGLGTAFVPLIFVGAVAKFWIYIIAVLGALVVFGLLLWLAFRVAATTAVRSASTHRPRSRYSCDARRNERWPAGGGAGSLTFIAQTAVPAKVERATPASARRRKHQFRRFASNQAHRQRIMRLARQATDRRLILRFLRLCHQLTSHSQVAKGPG